MSKIVVFFVVLATTSFMLLPVFHPVNGLSIKALTVSQQWFSSSLSSSLTGATLESQSLSSSSKAQTRLRRSLRQVQESLSRLPLIFWSSRTSFFHESTWEHIGLLSKGVNRPEKFEY